MSSKSAGCVRPGRHHPPGRIWSDSVEATVTAAAMSPRQACAAVGVLPVPTPFS